MPAPRAEPDPTPTPAPDPKPAPGPMLHCPDDAAWEAWLGDNHATATEIWLQIAKRGCDVPSVTYSQALDTALCFGWIDARKGGLDERFWLQRFTPRGRRSRWSQVNRERALALIESGRMRPAGAAQIDAARADGRWDAAYEAQSRATVPDDLQAALDAHPDAAAFFATLTGSDRYAFLYRLHHVKTAKARARRIAGYIEHLSAGQTLR